MKNFLKPMAIMIAMAIGMAACTKNSTNGDEEGSKPLNISIVLTENVSRAVAAPADQAAVNFNSGYVIFTNSLGVVNKVTEIVTGSYPASPSVEDEAARAAGTKAWLGDMKVADTGGEIRNVPAAATKVYIVGNLPSDVDAPRLAENISTVKDRVIRVASQSNLAGSVADVTLYGDGVTLVKHPSIDNAKYAQINVKAIASRIEIGKISYIGHTGLVTNFQIDGIFLNHYYPQMSLSGMATTALVNNTPGDNAAADAMYASGSTAYSDDALFDYDADGLGYKVVTDVSWQAADPGKSDDKNVWAYNMLAPTSYNGTNVTELAAPHIVIRLSNFVTTADASGKVYPGTQYLTVKRFRKASTSEIIESFVPGYIYYITHLTFDESHLTDIPEQEAVTAYVEAVLMTWTRQEVEWDF